jgi:hypothetical protein
MDAADRALYLMKEQYRQNPSFVKHATIDLLRQVPAPRAYILSGPGLRLATCPSEPEAWANWGCDSAPLCFSNYLCCLRLDSNRLGMGCLGHFDI